jgi:hypothetical protein
MWMRVASVQSQPEHEAIGQLLGPSGQDAFLGAERLDDKSWQWRDGTPWDFDGWNADQPQNDDDKKFVAIKWIPGFGVTWSTVPDDGHGVVCKAASISAIRGNIQTILQVGGPKSSALIAANEDL